MELIRIVRMEFEEAHLQAFEELFAENREAIRAMPGCTHLELRKDPSNPCVRYTLSHWKSAKELHAYRKSELFGQVWPKTKRLFAAPPQAFSLV
ncbi:MAG: antibiotic biosynthesis monooxygenase [Bacteroidota bacterium]